MQLKEVANIAFYNEQFLPFEQISISPLDRGFIFGEGIYTTLACQQGMPLFADRHIQRLKTQLKELYFPEVILDIEGVIIKLLELNQLEDAAVYVHITRGVDRVRDHLPTAQKPTVMFLAMPWNRPVHPGFAKACVLPDPRWSRCDYKVTSLIGNVQSSQKAHRQGFEKVIYHRDSFLTEAAQANLFLVKNLVLKTPPAGPYLLNGVTRQILLQEARLHGLETQEMTLTVDDLFEADEIFLTASLSQLVLIHQIDNFLLKTKHYPIAQLLFELYERYKFSYIQERMKVFKLNHAG
jgi:D-alanine transaminase